MGYFLSKYVLFPIAGTLFVLFLIRGTVLFLGFQAFVIIINRSNSKNREIESMLCILRHLTWRGSFSSASCASFVSIWQLKVKSAP